MRDRTPTQVLENGAVRYGLYDENGTLLRHVYIRPEDEPTDPGTPLTKRTLLADETALSIGLEEEDPTVDDALAALERKKQDLLSNDGLCVIKLQSSDPEGGIVTGGGIVFEGVTVTISAKETDGYVFDGWKENGARISSDHTLTFLVSQNRTLIADFFFPQYISGRDWFESSMPASSDWDRITYGDGTFLAICSGQKAARSADGVTWAQTMLPATDSSQPSWGAATYGSGKFVILSGNISGKDKFAYSEDGINFILGQMPAIANWKAVAFGEGKFIAIAMGSTLAAYSENGIDWTMANSLPYKISWCNAAYGNGKFVAVGYNSDGGRAAYSLDGITWAPTQLPKYNSWSGIAYGAGIFVAVGSSAFARSVDGITWDEIPLPANGYWESIAFGDGKFVAITQNTGMAAYSEDGSTWVTSAIPVPTAKDANCIAYGDKKFVAVVRHYDKAVYSFTGRDVPT